MIIPLVIDICVNSSLLTENRLVEEWSYKDTAWKNGTYVIQMPLVYDEKLVTQNWYGDIK